MTAELRINNTASAGGRYVGWAPSPCSIRLTSVVGTSGSIKVKLRNRPGGSGGQVVFRRSPTGKALPTLSLALPSNGTSVVFFISGKFGRPSVADGDAIIEAVRGGTVLASVPLMVRVRKDAEKLTPAERDRFIAAFAQLNNRGAGRFADYRDMHTASSSPQAHGAPGFLPWHRSYLLDLERDLQSIDSSVALPYWRFDKKAPHVFTLDFMGLADAVGTVQFGPTNPLQFWVTDGVPGINRRPFFDTTASAASVISETSTLALGGTYRAFRVMEGNPHGNAHTSFGGSISSIPTAAKDPLFFLLHCNVDRLWAKWQSQKSRFDQSNASSFDANSPGGNSIGHNLPDTMWPWNGVTGGSRPPTAPGGPMSSSPVTSAPGPHPKVEDMLDYQGAITASDRLGFDYDDVGY